VLGNQWKVDPTTCALVGAVAAMIFCGSFRPTARSTAAMKPEASSRWTNETFAVTVNNSPVSVKRYGKIEYSRFAFTGRATVTVMLRKPITRYRLTPEQFEKGAKVSGRSISFVLTIPQIVILRSGDSLSEQLFLLPRKDNGDLAQDGVSHTDAMSLPGIDNLGLKDNSAIINAAIKKLSEQGGGTLQFAAGVYGFSHSIYLGSNVTLLLQKNSVVKASASYRCCFDEGAMIHFDDVQDARLTGDGIVDGNAAALPRSSQNFHLICTDNARDIEIRNILLLDPPETALRLVDAHHAEVSNVDILANNPATLSDGIDLDSSDNVVIDKVFIFSSDDNTSFGGGTGPRRTIRDQLNIVFQNSTFYNARTGAAFKIGTHLPQNSISRVTYKNIDIVDCVQMAAFYPTFGAEIHDIVLTDIRVNEVHDRLLEFHAVVPYWEPNWNGRIGSIRNISLTNISAKNPGARRSSFIGYSPTQNIANICFSGYRIAGKSILNATAADIDFGPYVDDVAFKVHGTGGCPHS
jgi:Glycosyl hydrolases family 28